MESHSKSANLKQQLQHTLPKHWSIAQPYTHDALITLSGPHGHRIDVKPFHQTQDNDTADFLLIKYTPVDPHHSYKKKDRHIAQDAKEAGELVEDLTC